MGFFQSLKQDLSEAVGELIGEESGLQDRRLTPFVKKSVYSSSIVFQLADSSVY